MTDSNFAYIAKIVGIAFVVSTAMDIWRNESVDFAYLITKFLTIFVVVVLVSAVEKRWRGSRDA